jgi:ABC-type multidrug transport system ATPase subunit
MNAGSPAAQLPVLEVRGLAFEYPGGFRLGPLDLRLLPGELAALSGEPGVGKSTLLRLLAARLPAQSGTLLFRQEPLEWNPKHVAGWRRHLGILDQSVTLPGQRSTRELLRLSLAARGLNGKARRHEAMRILGETGQLPRADLPCGNLSTGQSRWAQLALALSGLPDLLLLDEPFAHLSPDHQDELLAFLIRQAARGTAILFCLHGDQPRLPEGVRRLRLEGGRLEGDGQGWRR